MRARDLNHKNIVIWGTGREGRAVLHMLRRDAAEATISFIDESPTPVADIEGVAVLHDRNAIARIVGVADVIIKSPGVSLYHPLLEQVRQRGGVITSLLNLWFVEPRKAKTIAVTGTKGKSTTASLITHALRGLGHQAVVLGNIGSAISETDTSQMDYVVIEVSSYQAANFDGQCDVAVLTSLYPEHLDWHQSLTTYYRDKMNLIAHGTERIINAEAIETLQQHGLPTTGYTLANEQNVLHVENNTIMDGTSPVGSLANAHLTRVHNLKNVCLVLTALKALGYAPQTVLPLLEGFHGLPHRQQELGLKDDILYVNDSISTTPQSAIAAIECYAEKPITLIVGGQDRGIDYTPLTNYIINKNIHAVIAMGASGDRIAEVLHLRGFDRVTLCTTMQEIVAHAKQSTPSGGVVLLSPAAPSYGYFKNFEDRGQKFAIEAGFPV